MRLFVALEISAAVRDNLAALLAAVRAADAAPSGRRARWVRPESLHVTLKFIGSVDARKLDEISSALSEICCDEAVELRFRGVGFFPDHERPRVFWGGIEGSPNLPRLVTAIDAQLAKIGTPRETREFAPHLTLARFDPPGASDKIRATAREMAGQEFGILRTGKFHLFESKTLPTGAQYTRLASFAFAKTEV